MMELALKLVSTLAKSGKSFKVLSMAFDEISGEILLADTATGAEFTLELKPLLVPTPAPRHLEPLPPPTIMARKAPPNLAPTFAMVRAAREWPTFSNEAKALIAELERAELRIGDDLLLIAAAKKAGSGDISGLRQLAEQRRPPASRAAAPPPPLQN